MQSALEAVAFGEVVIERADEARASGAGGGVRRERLGACGVRFVPRRGPVASGACAGAPPLCALVEAAASGRKLVLSLARGFSLHASAASEGRLSVCAGAGTGAAGPRWLLMISGASAPQLRLLATCVREDRLATAAEVAAAARHAKAEAAAVAAAAAAADGYADDLLAGASLRSARPPPAPEGSTVLRAPFSSLSAAAAAAAADEPELSAEQRAVVSAVLARPRGGVFFTGPAGTGKSLVLHALRRAVPSAHFAASTGVAALAIGGVTLHAWAGLPLAEADAYTAEAARLAALTGAAAVAAAAAAASGVSTLAPLLDAVLAGVRRRREALARWRSCETLVIDEISMVDAGTLDLLDVVGRRLRGGASAGLGVAEKERAAAQAQLPFGGLQLVFSGDFLQLPPVSRGSSGAVRFAFQARVWPAAVRHVVLLTRVFRQGADLAFIRALGELRVGRVSPETERLLNSRWAASPSLGAGAGEPTAEGAAGGAAAILPTRLETHRHDVDVENAEQLRALPGEEVEFRATDVLHGGGSADGAEGFAAKLLDSGCPAPRSLVLKAGAQVMLTRTLDARQGLVNGARGVVVSLGPPGTARHPTVRFVSGAEVVVRAETWAVCRPGGPSAPAASRRQLPLKLAYALSVHKSQGMTLDLLVVSLEKVFEYGQAYVALSRARSLEGLSLAERFGPGCVRAHPDVVRFYEAGCRVAGATAPGSRRGSEGAAGSRRGSEPVVAPAPAPLLAAAKAPASLPAPAPAPAPVVAAAAPPVRRPRPLTSPAKAAAAVVAPPPLPAASPRRPLAAQAAAVAAASSPQLRSPAFKRAAQRSPRQEGGASAGLGL
jgi:hypothetical protein